MNKTTEALKLAEVNLNIALTQDRWHWEEHCNEALAAIREALADHSGDANEMVVDWSKVKPEAIKSDPMYQMGYEARLAEPVKQELVAWGWVMDGEINDCIGPTEHARCEGEYTVPLYAAPVERDWVDLTDDEICDLIRLSPNVSMLWIVKDVISAFKEKQK